MRQEDSPEIIPCDQLMCRERKEGLDKQTANCPRSSRVKTQTLSSGRGAKL